MFSHNFFCLWIEECPYVLGFVKLPNNLHESSMMMIDDKPLGMNSNIECCSLVINGVIKPVKEITHHNSSKIKSVEEITHYDSRSTKSAKDIVILGKSSYTLHN